MGWCSLGESSLKPSLFTVKLKRELHRSEGFRGLMRPLSSTRPTTPLSLKEPMREIFGRRDQRSSSRRPRQRMCAKACRLGRLCRHLRSHGCIAKNAESRSKRSQLNPRKYAWEQAITLPLVAHRESRPLAVLAKQSGTGAHLPSRQEGRRASASESWPFWRPVQASRTRASKERRAAVGQL